MKNAVDCLKRERFVKSRPENAEIKLYISVLKVHGQIDMLLIL